MKKYLLFIFGYSDERIVLETLADLDKISDDIRFFTGDGYGIYHFESKEGAQEIKDAVMVHMEGMVQSVFVFCLEGEHSIEMDKELKDVFLDAKFDNKDLSDRFDKIKEKYINILDESMERDIGIIPLKELLKKHLQSLPEKPLSVDEILDKILEKGIKSLTKREKDFLDNQKKLLDGDK